MQSSEVEVHVAALSVSIPEELLDEFLSKLHYISEEIVSFELLPNERDQVRFRLRSGDERQASVIAGNIAKVAQKMCQAYRPSVAKVLVEHHVKFGFDADPHPLLEERGDLFRFGQGRYGFGPRLVELASFFDQRIVEMTKDFQAAPYQFPTLIGADVMERCKYLRSFPHSLSLVSHLREDLDAIQNFARTARWDGNNLVCNHEDLSQIQCLLSSAVCYHCYAWLQNSVLPQPRAFTAVGKCFRYESGNLGGIERLWDFTMRELIFVGPQEYVLARRQAGIDSTVVLLNEWGLDYDIMTATDPFFIDEYSVTTFQKAFDLKFEIRATLPYKAKTLAVGSFNFHQDYFGRALNITCGSGEAASTGCVAFGIERLVLAFLAQHGLDPKHWPEAVAVALKTW
jgi:seryl-tRNA synthetase